MTDLPKGWAWTTLGEVGAWRGGGTPSKRNPTFWEGGTIPWLSPKDMGDTVLKGTQDHITEAAVARSATSLIPADSVVVVVRSGILERTVPIGFAPFETTLNQDMKAIVPHPGVDARWLLYVLKSQIDVVLGTCRKDGTTVASIDTAKLQALPIPLPPLAEQHRIVEALEDHLSRLDAAEATLDECGRRARVLDDLCVDDVVLGRALSIPLTSLAAADLRGKYGRFNYQTLPPLPGDWEWKLAESVCESISCGSTPTADLMRQGRGEVPFLKVYNIDPAGRIDFTRNPTFISADTHRGQLRRSVARPGDVVTNIVGPPLGKSGVIPDSYPEWNHNQAIVSFRAGVGVEAEWLATCLRSAFIVGLLKSTARATAGQFNIALSTCRELPLPRPPIDVQRALLEELSEHQSMTRHARVSIDTAQVRSAALRRSLLRAAFNGELVDQDPNDEPATVALERLRAEAQPTRRRTTKRAAAASTRG